MKFRGLLSNCCYSPSPTAMENSRHGEEFYPFLCNVFLFIIEPLLIGFNEIESDRQDNESFRVYSYNELKSATNGFSGANKVGEGGFGIVYKVLPWL